MASDCGTVTVVEPFDPSNVTIPSCSNVPAEAAPNEIITVSAQVENANSQTASVEVGLNVNGSTGPTTTVTIPANSSQTVEFQTALPAAEGDYTYTTTIVSATQA